MTPGHTFRVFPRWRISSRRSPLACSRPATGSDTLAKGIALGLVIGIGYALTLTAVDANVRSEQAPTMDLIRDHRCIPPAGAGDRRGAAIGLALTNASPIDTGTVPTSRLAATATGDLE